jgi:hypothetical protein
MASSFYLAPEHAQALLQEFLDAQDSIDSINTFQVPPENVNPQSGIRSLSQSGAKVYGPNYLNQSTLNPNVLSELPQKDLARELMNQQIRKDSAGAALQLRDPATSLRMPPPSNPPSPQGTTSPRSLSGMRDLSPILMFLDLLTRSGDLNAGEDQQTGRAAQVDKAQKTQQQRNSVATPTNNQDILQTLMRALSVTNR